MTPRRQRPRLTERRVASLQNMLSQRGLSDTEISRALEYIEGQTESRVTLREAFELAMTRVRFTDAEITAGLRFTYD